MPSDTASVRHRRFNRPRASRDVAIMRQAYHSRDPECAAGVVIFQGHR